MTINEDLHRLVDELPESEMHVALRFLEYLRNPGSDPFVRALMLAPEDDEPYTPEDQKASDEAWKQYLEGDVRSWEDVRQELTGEQQQS
jgi:hypothetical protein